MPRPDAVYLDDREIAATGFGTSPAAVASYSALQQAAFESNPDAADEAAAAAAAAQQSADDAAAAAAGKQDYSDILQGLSALPVTLGLVEQVSAEVFGIRAIGATGPSSIPDLAAADGRYVQQDVGPAWANPTGTLTRSTFATYAAPTANVAYSQAEMQAVMNAVQALSERLAAVVTDLRANGALT